MNNKTVVNVDGQNWYMFDLKYTDCDGRSFAIPFYATSRDHAACIVDDIRNTATLGDQIIEIAKC
ncbi:hypothetical protein GTGU_01238 [Trabulsiella guamensis ATCC 49490]|uniref:Uncharacterized protein n=1 Tax=Trabulsiella guamensis ATCC 49490 TaxID=1005994 RepID=A0A085AFQ1_9ENTR|nr:hypothetical protein [Trabulsiella guamensis]KFC09046.1 hypothetical protein GTGU_01238 [Trabulsiella guamensis ATCC 49490]